MKILIMRIDLRANWVHSLKEKRMVVKSIVKKLQNTFNISVIEVDNQDLHHRITIGISKIDLNNSQCNSSMESIISFIEGNTDAEIIGIKQIFIINNQIKMNRISTCFASLLLSCALTAQAQQYQLNSPDGKLIVNIEAGLLLSFTHRPQR